MRASKILVDSHKSQPPGVWPPPAPPLHSYDTFMKFATMGSVMQKGRLYYILYVVKLVLFENNFPDVILRWGEIPRNFVESH